MATATITVKLKSDITKVWDLVTSLDNYTWRSDLSKIVVLDDGKKFIEYTKDGYPTNFTVTVFEPLKRWEFDIENDNMLGHWIGVFSFKDGETTIDFSEDVTAKKRIMKPFVGTYLKKQQKVYVEDLKKALKQYT